MAEKGLSKAYVGVLVALVLLGLIGFGLQVSQGLGVTGMRNVVSWGLYITAFMFFVGLSAGGLIVSAASNVFNAKQFKPVAIPAVILSLSSSIVAALLIIPDLGNPLNMWRLFVNSQWGSPLMWDVAVITLYIVISAVYLYHMVKGNESTVKKIALVALPAAIAVHSVTAWIFGLLVARPYWNSAILAPLFITSALVSGLALLIVALRLLNKYGLFRTEDGIFHSLANLLTVLIPVDLFMLFAELLTSGYQPGTEHAHALEVLVSGQFAPVFWTEVIAGGLIPFVVLCWERNRKSPNTVAWMSVLVVLGIFLKRVQLMGVAMFNPLITYAPGVMLGDYVEPPLSPFAATGAYFPTWVEWMVFAGVIAGGMLLFSYGVKLFATPAPKAAKSAAAQSKAAQA